VTRSSIPTASGSSSPNGQSQSTEGGLCAPTAEAHSETSSKPVSRARARLSRSFYGKYTVGPSGGSPTGGSGCGASSNWAPLGPDKTMQPCAMRATVSLGCGRSCESPAAQLWGAGAAPLPRAKSRAGISRWLPAPAPPLRLASRLHHTPDGFFDGRRVRFRGTRRGGKSGAPVLPTNLERVSASLLQSRGNDLPRRGTVERAPAAGGRSS
jgi:hypothetical protein